MQSTNWSSSSYGKEYLFRVSLIDKKWYEDKFPGTDNWTPFDTDNDRI